MGERWLGVQGQVTTLNGYEIATRSATTMLKNAYLWALFLFALWSWLKRNSGINKHFMSSLTIVEGLPVILVHVLSPGSFDFLKYPKACIDCCPVLSLLPKIILSCLSRIQVHNKSSFVFRRLRGCFHKNTKQGMCSLSLSPPLICSMISHLPSLRFLQLQRLFFSCFL